MAVLLPFTPRHRDDPPKKRRLFDIDPRSLRAGPAHEPQAKQRGDFTVYAVDCGTEERIAMRVWAEDCRDAREVARVTLLARGRSAANLQIGLAVPGFEAASAPAPAPLAWVLFAYWRFMWMGW